MFRDFFFEKWKDWDFGRNQLLGFDLFQSWITIGSAVDVADIWEKAVNTFFTINWQAKLELGENIDGLEKWKQFIPSENFEVVCKTIVGKLGREIENWNLFVENVAIHTWVLPWICLLDLGSIYPRIISKFELALDKWQAKDRSAKLLLKPWKVVLSQFWDDFVVLHVLPKLLLFLQEFEIPQDFSKTKSIKCVVEWVGLIPIEHIRDGFRNIFYPKWRKVLNGLLESSLDMEKVFEWVKYWQKKVPEQILKIEI
jgi:tuftelin-interacting protein 11